MNLGVGALPFNTTNVVWSAMERPTQHAKTEGQSTPDTWGTETQVASSNSKQKVGSEHRKCPPHRSVKRGSPRQVTTAEASRKMEGQRTFCEVFYGVWVCNAFE